MQQLVPEDLKLPYIGRWVLSPFYGQENIEEAIGASREPAEKSETEDTPAQALILMHLCARPGRPQLCIQVPEFCSLESCCI